MTSVLVVDDQPLIRQAVRDILTDAGVHVVGDAATGRTAVSAAADLTPDVVLMDIRMPDGDGIEATARICADRPSGPPRVLILTTFEEDEYVVAALRAGASGFIGKGAEPEDIVRAVRTIDAGESLLSSSATRTLIERTVRREGQLIAGAHREALERLTPREREVLTLVASGRSNQEIAFALTISPHTAKTHVNRIMTKVDARDRAQLVILAYEAGVVVAGA